mmetsp:Transcript_9351/g.14091  ORF Transcript_9351/g.14091 Transcript_9351/m.14091 type:complete len:450 (+) Transcript_9351:137-1486(+)
MADESESEDSIREGEFRSRRMSTGAVYMQNLSKKNLSPIITAVINLETTPKRSDVVSKLEQIVEKNLKFRSYIHYPSAEAGPIWKPLLKFEVGDVMIDETLPGIDKKREICSFLGERLDLHFSDDEPQWRIFMVTYASQNERGECDLVIQMSHGLGDGYSLFGLLMSVAEPFEDVHATLPTIQKRNSAQSELNIFEKISLSFKRKQGLLKMLNMPMRTPDPPSCLTAQDNVSEDKKLADFRAIPLDRFKRCKHGTTINNVALSCLNGAIRRYLLSRSDPIMLRKNPKITVISMVAGLPKSDVPGVSFKVIFVPLELKKAEPVNQLRKVSRATRKIFACNEDGAGASLNSMLYKYAPFKIFNEMIGKSIGKCTCFFSNVRGPPSPMVFAGSKIRRIHNFVNPQLAFVLSMVSYNNEMCLSLATNSSLLSLPNLFLDMFEEELNGLEECEG